MQEKIQHFGVWIKKSETNKISRNHYAVIDKKSSTWSPKIWKLRHSCYQSAEERQKYYDDEECKIYSDFFCMEWQEKCLINFDKNMVFFEQTSKEEFEKAIQELIRSIKEAKQIFNLNDCKNMCGIYIMVLDDYKQVYIGQAKDIKRRVMSHWSNRKEFDRLLWGNVNNSVLSIDSFGALDTTRIFVLESTRLNFIEKFVVNKMPAHFRLNRIGGGTINDNLDLIIALRKWNLRPLKDCHSEEFAEKYEKEIEVTYFKLKEYCMLEKLSKGDIICLETTQKGGLLTTKCYGEFIKASKSRLYLYKYCGPILENSCYSSEFKNKKMFPEEIMLNKTMIISKVDMVEKKEIHIFWRSKKFPHIEA